MNDAVWARHANPWSVWTQILTPPPMLAASICSRIWIGWWCLLPLAPTLPWIRWNPRAFRPPRSTRRWTSRGVLAERTVIECRAAVPAHHRRATAVLTGITALAILPFA